MGDAKLPAPPTRAPVHATVEMPKPARAREVFVPDLGHLARFDDRLQPITPSVHAPHLLTDETRQQFIGDLRDQIHAAAEENSLEADGRPNTARTSRTGSDTTIVAVSATSRPRCVGTRRERRLRQQRLSICHLLWTAYGSRSGGGGPRPRSTLRACRRSTHRRPSKLGSPTPCRCRVTCERKWRVLSSATSATFASIRVDRG